MKKIETKDAVGHVICHDITIIVKDQIKDIAFRKGHIVREEDIPQLLSIGKDHLYVWEKEEGMLHENEAAEILASVCESAYMKRSPVKEGKIELSATQRGLFQIDLEKLCAINELEDIMIASRHHNQPVNVGDKLVGTRVIPLVISEEKMKQVKEIGGKEPLFRILPYKRKTAGVVTTGNEVYYGRIQDTFTPVIREKLKAYDVEVLVHKTVPDKKEKIVEAIREIKGKGVDLVLCTGGMSVDPDDMTPSAIKESGAQIISYGAPVLPGAMFLLGCFSDGTPVIGLPGCVMYAKATIFDLLLPRILADVPITKKDLAKMGAGGLCLGCDICMYPNCGFGKGV